MNRWLDRPGYVVVLAFLAGAAVVAVIAIVIFVRRGDGGSEQAAATATVSSEPAATTSATPGATPGTPAATTTPGRFGNPDDALAAFVRDQLQAEYIGGCPLGVAPGPNQPQGYCSLELYRSAALVTFNIARPGKDALGEAVLTPDAGGLWTVTFLEAPRLDIQIAVGSQAMVYQAGDCLRFREAPGTNAKVISCRIDGTKARLLEGPAQADGQTWWRLEGFGWAVAQYLAPAP